MGAGVAPGDADGLPRVLREQGLQELRDLAPTLAPAGDRDGLAGVPVHRAEAVAAHGLRRGRDHHPLAERAPHRA
ncbi:MAG TPA: hypothetical protein VFR62_07280 [Gemmatimonadales bacterium]|nr:hypothetical protein [Gemmatimonadales bacterium]